MSDVQQAVRLETHGDVGLVLINYPPVNALGQPVRQGLRDCLAKAEADPAIKAIVIACEGSTFIAGADIREFGKPPTGPSLTETIDAMEAGTKPVVAAIHGTSLGGGFEVAMATHARVLDKNAKIGLPEVKLGLIPGAAGTQRLPRLIGMLPALEICATGRHVKAQEALALGCADAIAEGDLREAAIAHARSLIGKPPRRSSELKVPAYDKAEFAAAVAAVKKKARGQASPVAIADAVSAADGDYRTGVKIERDLFLKLLVSDQSKAMRHVFFAEREVLKVPHLIGVKPRALASAGVIGSGTMGAGIAISLVDSGLPVTIVETSDKALEAGRTRLAATWDRNVKLGRITQAERDARFNRVTFSLDFASLAQCDLIIEAVFEQMAVKKDIFGRLGKVAKAGAVLASNTSYLDIDEIGQSSGRPADVIGMHFFSPANIMRLVEVIEGRDSAKDAVATGVEVTRRMGKLPVVCGVCDGFVGNRILSKWRAIPDFAVEEGALPQEIDAALENYGMAMGPYAVGDLAGLDIGMLRRRELAPFRDPEKRDASQIAEKLCELGRYGQKTGAGYYKYVDGKRTVDPEVTKIIEEVSKAKGITRKPVSADAVIRHIRAVMVNEGAKILSEGIVPRALDIDMVLLNGYGFPMWRGGPMFEADSIGLPQILKDMQEVHAMAGKGFEPAALLVELAGSGRTFGSLKPGEATGAASQAAQ